MADPSGRIKMFSVNIMQVFTKAGYIVIAPNFRGSTGYGKTFQRLIYKDWGGAEFKDVVESYMTTCSPPDTLIKTGLQLSEAALEDL